MNCSAGCDPPLPSGLSPNRPERPPRLARKPRITPRAPAHVPVQVEVAHAWDVSAKRIAGEIWDVSRGGAKVRLPCVLPPHTRLRLILSSAGGTLQLSAEVVWTSAFPGTGKSKPFYGLRWVGFVAQATLDVMLAEPDG
jgi:hypothetical protein